MRLPRVLRIRDGLEQTTLEAAVQVLKRGLLVIVPTDTVYGLAADPHAPEAVERLYLAKGRDTSKPIALLADGIAAAEEYGAAFGDVERRLAEKFWPGPLTMVLSVGDGFEGFRVPGHEVTLSLLRMFGGPLRVTSANRSHEPPKATADEAALTLGSYVDLVLDAGSTPGTQPSTVSKVVNDEIEILREGAIPRSVLEKECLNV